MNKKEKLLGRITNNNKGVRFSDLQKILEWDGWEISSQTSSHYTYSKQGVGRVTIVRKADGMAKPYYVKVVLKLMGC